MRLRRVVIHTLIASVVWIAPAASQTVKRAFTLDDLAKLKTVNDPQRSPDGAWVAYTVGSSDVEKDKRDGDLWMTSWDGTRHVRLTSSKDSSESVPRWSPDGKYLAFLASRGDEDEKKKGSQVWLLNRAGGEAEKLTDVKGGVSDYAWSPDSARLVLVVNDPNPDDDPEKKDGWKRKTKPPIVIDRYHFKQDRDGYLRRLYSHLALFDVQARTLEPLTSGAFDDIQPAWSPDGSRIVFVSKRGADPDRTIDTNIWVIDAKKDSTARQLTTFAGEDGGRPAWSPDGKTIAYLQGEEARFFAYQQDRLAIIPAEGGAPTILTSGLDRSVRAPVWSRDGRSLLVVVEDDRTGYVARVPAGGGSIEKLTEGPRVVRSISAGEDGGIALLASTDAMPFEAHALERGTLRKLSAHNDALMSELQLGVTEDVTFKAKDGTVVNGILVKPATAASGTRLPLILWIHGGPNGQDDHAFDDERELFAANGYAVLQVNYRGSAGRGSGFQKAIYADWGNKEVVDLLAGVDWAVASGVADPARLGIGGWSYGGILTNYTIASDSRFKAAASGAGSSLQFTMYGIDQYIVQYENEIGSPWKKPDVWMKVSYPFFKADRIKTPTLFMCGERDFNVPIAGAEQMYQALKVLGIDTELVVYPGQFHTLAIPSYNRDRMERYVAWFDKYLKPAGAPTPTPTTAAK
jgi:dipeptidyl aminopeptidase/acylaminoacyl peptidase